jgi:hypothetical protein
MRITTGGWLRLGLVILLAGFIVFRYVAPRFAKWGSRGRISDLSVSSPLNQPGGGEISAEAYEIYSALYQEPQPEPLAFAEDSQADIPQVNGSCLTPTSPEEHELVDAFVAGNQQSHQWQRKFTIPAGYLQLSKSEAAKAENCIANRGSAGGDCAPYKKYLHVRLLGVPGVDRAHAHALVSVVKMCGKYCGSGGIFEVEKAGGTWRRAAASDFTRNCSWMY